MSTPVVLITGALTGIGRATALAFARDGARIVVSGRRDEAGQALAAELRGLGAKPSSVRADVRHEDDVRGLIDQTVARFGRLDVAVNNAGTEGQPGPVTDQTAETYAATFDTNVLGTLLSMKHELRVMIGQGHGSIINLSSTFGHKGGCGCIGLHGQQTCGRGADEGGRARRGCRPACASMPSRRPGRDRDAGPVHRHRQPKGRPDRRRAAAARGGAGRDRRRHRVSRIRQGAFLTGQIISVDGGKSAQ